MDWKIADAEERFDELVDRALHQERQQIETDEGVVVLISQKELEHIEGKKSSLEEYLLSIQKVEETDFSRDESVPEEPERETKPRNPLIEYLKNGPGFEGMDISRDKSPARDVKW